MSLGVILNISSCDSHSLGPRELLPDTPCPMTSKQLASVSESPKHSKVSPLLIPAMAAMRAASVQGGFEQQKHLDVRKG